MTGHRDLDHREAVSAATKRALSHIEQRLGADGRVRLHWTIVSPLAKGADRAIADAVLAHASADGRAELEVVTPLALDEYRRDFRTPDDLGDFERLFARRTSLTELNVDVADPRAPTVRNKCYRDVGDAIVRACEILIAVWDGTPARGEGGTAEIVQYALDRGRLVLCIPPGEAPEPKVLRPWPDWVPAFLRRRPHRVVSLPGAAKGISSGAHQLAAYLRDRVVSDERLETALLETETRLREATGEAGMPADCIDPLLEHVAPHFARADALAVAYQALHTRAVRSAFYLAATAVTFAALQAIFFPTSRILTAFEVLSMVGILVMLALNRLQAWHEKWVNDRYLAEHLRTALHTLLLGEDPSPRALSVAEVLPFYAGPKTWLPSAVRDIVRSTKSCALGAAPLEALEKFIAHAWLAHQSRWHAGNAVKKHRRLRLRRFVVVGLFGLTLTVAASHQFVGHGEHADPLASPEKWFAFLAIVLPSWATAIHAMGRQLEYERVAARSKQMAPVLERLALAAEQARTLEELHLVVREATQVVALENHEWSVLLTFAPPELAV